MRGTAGFPVRLRYTKRGKVRWISHRDVARAFERAFRITALPLAFTEGFSPRPKVSFGLALSTGYESDAEYLDVELASAVDVADMAARVSDALPHGIDVTGAVPLAERAPALMEAVTSVEWHVAVAHDDGTPVAADVLASAVGEALAMPVLSTTRRRKGRDVVEDVRPVIDHLHVHGDTCAMELNTRPRSAKPGDVLAAVASAARVPGGLAEANVLRTHQWIERDGARHEPLRADTRPSPGIVPVDDEHKGTSDVQRAHDAGALAGVSGRSGDERGG
jgi:radical SAM-linked protein